MLRRLARALVLKYPQPWLDRYGDEVLELVDASSLRRADLVELGRGLLVERMKALVEPGDSPRVAFVVIGSVAMLVRVAPSVLVIGGAVALGEGARRWTGPPPDYVMETGVLILVAVVTTHFWRKWTTRDRHRWGARAYDRFPASMRVAIIAAMFVSTFILYWTPRSAPAGMEALSPLLGWSQLFIWITFVDSLTSAFWPWRPMFDAFDAYSEAVRELRRAQDDVDRCRTLVHAGTDVSQDLVNAVIARDRLIQQRDDAAAILHGYGYRARFLSVE